MQKVQQKEVGKKFGHKEKKMTNKIISGECDNCESSFEVAYSEELVSEEKPSFCPFCGEPVEDIVEEYIDDDDYDENEEWK
jgi:hypothetical protein